VRETAVTIMPAYVCVCVCLCDGVSGVSSWNRIGRDMRCGVALPAAGCS